MTIGLPNASARAVRQSCVVVAFWFEQGIEVEPAQYLFDILAKLPAHYLRILEPHWLLAVYPDAPAVRRNLAGALSTLLAKRDGHEVGRDWHIGLEIGELIMQLDQHGRSLSHPIGFSMSRAMKKASEASDGTPFGLENLNL